MTVFEPKIQRVHRESLKFLANDLKTNYSLEELQEIFNDSHISNVLGYNLKGEDELMNLLIDLSKLKNEYGFLVLLDYVCSLQMFQGDNVAAQNRIEKYAKVFKADKIDYGDGRWWQEPHHSMTIYGDDQYRNSSGEVYEPPHEPRKYDEMKGTPFFAHSF